MILRRCSRHFIYWTTVNQRVLLQSLVTHYITSSWCNDYCNSGGWVCLDPRSSWSGIQTRLGLSPSTDCLQCMILKTVHAEVASFPGPAQLSVAYSMETIFLYCKQEKAAWVGPGTRLCWVCLVGVVSEFFHKYWKCNDKTEEEGESTAIPFARPPLACVCLFAHTCWTGL